MEYIIEKERKTPVSSECDVVVAGGGTAGIAAALAAARSGADVTLIEKQCALGGLATLGLITFYEPLCDGNGNQVIFGIAEELLKLSIKYGYESRYPKAWLEGGTYEERRESRYNVQFNAALFAISVEQLLLKEGIRIIYRTGIYDVALEDDKIKAVLIENKEGRSAIKAKAFIDATGDADLCAFSGEETEINQQNSLSIWYYYNYKDGYKYCPINPSFEEVGRFYDGMKQADETEFIIKGHEYVLKDVLKRRENDPTVMPVTIPNLPDFRQTRRLSGALVLQEEDARTIDYPDTIGKIGDWRARGHIYNIPYSCLYGKKIKNLITAGRCISSDGEMWELTRVIPVCALTGEAAGNAASIAVKCNCGFSEVDISALKASMNK